MLSKALKQQVVVPYRNSEKVKPYLEALRRSGIDPVPHLADGPTRLGESSGLLLTGGTDVNPQRYGERARAETDAPDDERDLVELDLINQAIEKDLPILAICRGLQILNVYHGGTLFQHLGSLRHDPELEDRSQTAHQVRVDEGTLLNRVIRWHTIDVNSRHHQAVATLGTALRISARDAQDGTVEALERPDKRFVLAVQWHPEDQVDVLPEHLRLFEGFAEALTS